MGKKTIRAEINAVSGSILKHFLVHILPLRSHSVQKHFSPIIWSWHK